MKGLRKCLLYVPLFVLLLTVSFLESSNNNTAIAQSPNACTLDTTATMNSSTGTIINYLFNNPQQITLNGVVRSLPAPFSEYKAFISVKQRVDSEGYTRYLLWASKEPIVLSQSGTLHNATFGEADDFVPQPLGHPSATYGTVTNTSMRVYDDNTIQFQSGISTRITNRTTTLYTSSTDNPRVCTYSGQVTFDESWNSTTGSSVSLEEPPAAHCTALDFGCWINQAWDASTKALLEGITYLFVPDTKTLEYAFSEMADSLVQTLGFLVYPVQWIMDILDGLYVGIISDGNWGTGFCAIDSYNWGLPHGTFFGENIEIDFCSTMNTPIESAAKIFFPVFISYALIRAFKVKIDEVHEK